MAPPAHHRALPALWASALLLAAAASRAVEFDTGAGPLLSPDALTAGDAPAAQETTSPCDCAAKPRCWKVAMAVDARMVGLREDEIEKALPNRYFPATLTFALRRPTPDGHFLLVKCGPARRVCADKRDILEERLIKSSLLSSLPLNLADGTLFDPETLKLTALGDKTFETVKQCRKALLSELAAVVLGPAPAAVPTRGP